MGDFNKSAWADAEFSDHYLDRADIYVQERRKLLGLLKTVYRNVFSGQTGLSVCDLGSGDGIITETLLQYDDSIRPTLIDASSSMLKKARGRNHPLSITAAFPRPSPGTSSSCLPSVSWPFRSWWSSLF